MGGVGVSFIDVFEGVLLMCIVTGSAHLVLLAYIAPSLDVFELDEFGVGGVAMANVILPGDRRFEW